jgi:hypothetical protein
MSCQYIYPLPSVAETNDTLIGKTLIRVLDCSTNIKTNELCGLWNFNKCPSDREYCQPFVEGDIIYNQFFTPKNYYHYTFLHIIDVSTGEDIVTAINPLTTEVGVDKNNNKFLNIMIDTSKLDNIECIYFKFIGYTCEFKGTELTEFNACVAALVAEGKTTSQAREICLTSFCPDGQEIFYSEPYCKVKCQNTILVKGYYPNYDCNGNFYGTFTSGSTTNSFIPQVRLFGTIEPTQFDIEETLIGSKRKSSKLLETFLLRTKRIPYYVAQQLSNIFASKTITVEGVDYTKAINLAKNNDEGSMWIISSTLVKECSEINFTCDN